jgi:hypothetical protein
LDPLFQGNGDASGQQLDADEIADLLDNAIGDYSQAYQVIAHEYIKYFVSIVSAKLRLKLTPTQLSSDFDDGDAINALAPIEVAQRLLDRSQRKGQRASGENSVGLRAYSEHYLKNRSKSGMSGSLVLCCGPFLMLTTSNST